MFFTIRGSWPLTYPPAYQISSKQSDSYIKTFSTLSRLGIMFWNVPLYRNSWKRTKLAMEWSGPQSG